MIAIIDENNDSPVHTFLFFDPFQCFFDSRLRESSTDGKQTFRVEESCRNASMWQSSLIPLCSGTVWRNERKSDNRNFLLPQFKNQTLVDRENRENSVNC